MLKIVLQRKPSDGAATLSLEGQIVGPWVEELRRVCEELVASGTRLSLDLCTVTFVSREGVRLLWALADRQVALLHCSGFVVEQLKAPSGMAT